MMRLQAKTFQSDGINLASGFLVERSDIVRQIISTAKSRQQIVVSSPPATGKTSLMTLVEAEILKHTNGNTEEAVNIVLLREVHGGAATLRTIRKLVGIDDHGPAVVG
jgi:replication-associated recombination protein RarA